MNKRYILLATLPFMAVAKAQTFAQWDGGVPATGAYVNNATNERWVWNYSANKDHSSSKSWGGSGLGGYEWQLTFDHEIDFEQLGRIYAFSDLDATTNYSGSLSVSGGTATIATLSPYMGNDGMSSYDNRTGKWSYQVKPGTEDASDYMSINGSGTFTSLTFKANPGANSGDLIAMDVSQQKGYRMEAVPEPSSTSLLGLGTIALILRRKR